ncbi:MAG: glycosyltransferase family 1 protein, partial [Calditrichaeota bacterium]|nr:glycosyltransferase family 1 protein [Calditrichota bacterium]
MSVKAKVAVKVSANVSVKVAVKVAVDVRALCVPTFGIGRYTRCILDELIPETPDIRWFLYADRPVLQGYDQHNNVVTRQYPNSSKIKSLLRTQFQFARWARADAVDVFWSPRHHLPIRLDSSIRTVVTVHDLVWQKYPETMMFLNLLVEKLLMPPSLDRADRILCVSQSTADDVALGFPANKSKLVVTPLAACAVETPRTPNMKSPYMLFVGTLEPRKNLVRILKAYARAKASLQETRLVIIGAQGWMDDIRKHIDSEGLTGSVDLLGYLEEEALHGYYQHALCLLMPSLYEGFGLPALEAMNYGVP